MPGGEGCQGSGLDLSAWIVNTPSSRFPSLLPLEVSADHWTVRLSNHATFASLTGQQLQNLHFTHHGLAVGT